MTSQKQKKGRSSGVPMDDEPGPSGIQSQVPRSSSSRGKKKDLSDDEEDRLSAEIVRYLVCCNSKRVPVKRKGIIDAIGPMHAPNYSELMELAKQKLTEVFGLRCEEIEHASQKCYILVNNLKMEECYTLVDWSVSAPQMGLLFTVLSILMMAQRPVPEQELWSCLQDVQIVRDKKHVEFGDVNKLIGSEFVHHLYLSVEKKLEGDKKVNYYSWGKRAWLEMDRHKMLAFIAELHSSTYDSWRERYRSILAEGNQQPVGEGPSGEGAGMS